MKNTFLQLYLFLALIGLGFLPTAVYANNKCYLILHTPVATELFVSFRNIDELADFLKFENSSGTLKEHTFRGYLNGVYFKKSNPRGYQDKDPHFITPFVENQSDPGARSGYEKFFLFRLGRKNLKDTLSELAFFARQIKAERLEIDLDLNIKIFFKLQSTPDHIETLESQWIQQKQSDLQYWMAQKKVEASPIKWVHDLEGLTGFSNRTSSKSGTKINSRKVVSARNHFKSMIADPDFKDRQIQLLSHNPGLIYHPELFKALFFFDLHVSELFQLVHKQPELVSQGNLTRFDLLQEEHPKHLQILKKIAEIINNPYEFLDFSQKLLIDLYLSQNNIQLQQTVVSQKAKTKTINPIVEQSINPRILSFYNQFLKEVDTKNISLDHYHSLAWSRQQFKRQEILNVLRSYQVEILQKNNFIEVTETLTTTEFLNVIRKGLPIDYALELDATTHGVDTHIYQVLFVYKQLLKRGVSQNEISEFHKYMTQTRNEEIWYRHFDMAFSTLFTFNSPEYASQTFKNFFNLR